MGKVYLLDCTLRDGGYINDWNFGEDAIKGIGRKIAQTGIEIFEVGFIKGTDYNPDRSVFPDVASISRVIQPKDLGLKYVGMVFRHCYMGFHRVALFRAFLVFAVLVLHNIAFGVDDFL